MHFFLYLTTYILEISEACESEQGTEENGTGGSELGESNHLL